MLKLVTTTLLFLSLSSYASDNDILTVDRTVSKNIQLSFPNEKNIKPKESEFKVLNYVLMSNETGERWSVITIENTASGNRSLEHNHIMGLFADGSRFVPQENKLQFEGGEIQSITVSFGEYKFPILAIYTSLDGQ